MKKSLFFLIVIFLFGGQVISGKAKYIFYFIGDGMGVNHVNASEMYLSALKGEIGVESLLMTQFPVASMATTFSSNNGVTDSAASGTALASGVKTNNGTIGLDANNVPVVSVAEMAKKAGKKVGIVSTVPINHATPGAFYGHQKNRGMYYEIALDMLEAGFDFYGGSDLIDRNKTYDGKEAVDIYSLIDRAGYTLFEGHKHFEQGYKTAEKVILLPEKGRSIPFAIDRKEDDLTLKQLIESGISSLMKNNKNGFFFMAEGGKIDGACHIHDGKTAIMETLDFDEAIKVAFEFYKKHPKETLIVVTADHETGGLILCPDQTELSVLQYQKQSLENFMDRMEEFMTPADGRRVSWEEVKDYLGKNMGFWKELPISWEHEKLLRDTYEDTPSEKALIAVRARTILNQMAKLYWVDSHSSGYVPVFAIGAGQELFTHKMDNIDIPKKIIKAGKY